MFFLEISLLTGFNLMKIMLTEFVYDLFGSSGSGLKGNSVCVTSTN